MPYYKTFVTCFLALLHLFPSYSQPSNRIKYNFNSDWKVLKGDQKDARDYNFNDGNWKKVTLPYAWNEDDAFKKDIVDLSTGIAWYRKRFKIPANSKDQKVFLEFEGIRQAGTFYLNDSLIGEHENGVMAFGFDITPFVKFGNEENVLAVRIDNDWNYSGPAFYIEIISVNIYAFCAKVIE